MDGMTGKQIYDNFTNGIGSDKLSAGAAITNEVAAKYGDRASGVQRLIGKMDAAWQGEAAGAAMRGFGPVGVEHELAGQALATAQDLTNRQVGSFGDARNAVVPVPPEPVAPDPWAVFTSPGEVKSYYQQVAEYNAASQHNVDVMTGYTDASVYNANGLPRSYGALSPDQAGMVIDPGTSDTPGGPERGGSDGGPLIERRSGGESPTGDSGRVSQPSSDAGGPAGSAGGPPLGGGGGSVPQQTAPGGFTPALPGGPATRVPVGAGGVGSGPPLGGPGGGLAPGTGFVPIGGTTDGGPGGRGVGGPGGRGGAPGSGSGSELRGPGGRAGAGEPHAPGGRPGAGPVSGGVPGEAHGGGTRGGVGSAAGRAGAMGGGMPLAGGGRGRDEENLERRAPDYLQEDDPEGLFGTDQMTAPPVIGEDLESPDEQPDAG